MESTTPILAYGYIRYSTLEQSEGDSVRRQLESIRTYCARKGFHLVEEQIFKDLGVSAYDGSNIEATNVRTPALRQFIDQCVSGKIPPGVALVAEHIDRITRRDPWSALGTLHEIRNLGVEMHFTMTDNFISTPGSGRGNPNDSLGEVLKVLFGVSGGNQESAKKSERIRDVNAAKRASAAKGEAFVSKSLPWWLVFEGKKDKRRIVSPPKRKQVVQKIFEWTASGWSSMRIARTLNRQKVATWRKAATHWRDSRVRDLIRSDAPLGYLTPTYKTIKAGGPAKDYRIPGYYPKVVSEALALKARAAMQANKTGEKSEGEQGRPINLLNGILRHDGRWCRHQSQRNGATGPDSQKSWNNYYDDHDPDHEGHKTWSVSGRQLETLLVACLMASNPDDFLPPQSRPLKQSIVLRDDIIEMERQIAYIVTAIGEGKPPIALTKRLNELEEALAGQKKLLNKAIAREATPHKDIAARAIPSFNLDLKDPVSRLRTATAIRKLISRVDVVDNADDLPIPPDEMDDALAGLVHATHVPDPLPLDKRFKPHALLVTFRGGGKRIMMRHALGLFSARFAGELHNESPEMIERNFAEMKKRPSPDEMRASRKMSASARKAFQGFLESGDRKRKS